MKKKPGKLALPVCCQDELGPAVAVQGCTVIFPQTVQPWALVGLHGPPGLPLCVEGHPNPLTLQAEADPGSLKPAE